MHENNVSRSLEVTAEQFIDKHDSIFWVCLITCIASWAMAASSCMKYLLLLYRHKCFTGKYCEMPVKT